MFGSQLPSESSRRVPSYTQGNRMRIASWRRAVTLATRLTCAVALAQPLAAQTGSLQGRITDTSGTAIVGAMVTVDGTPLRTTASSRGSYTLAGVPTGQRMLRVRSLGFAPESLVVSVTGGNLTTADVTLRASRQQLASVLVVVGSRARHTAAEELAVPVDVYTVEEIARAGSTETAQVLANLSPSVNFPKQA